MNVVPQISIIIPVYNAEKYLRQCINSVINQTLQNIEIICIDDGSTDKSLDILKEFANIDSRIILIKKKLWLRGYNEYWIGACQRGLHWNC